MVIDWTAFLREFGFPVTVLAVVSVGFYRRWFVLGSEAEEQLNDLRKDYEARLTEAEAEKAYREERRIEERDSRIKTEETLRSLVGGMRDMTELLKDIEREFRGPK